MATGDIDFGDIPDPLHADPQRRAPDPPPPPPAPAEPSPTRAEGSRRRLAAIALSVAWIAGFVIVILGVRPDLAQLPVILQLVAWTIALPIGLSVALLPRASGFPPGVVAVRATLVAIVVLFVGLALLPVSGLEADPTVATVGVCLSFALLLALAPLTGAVVVLRSAFINAPILRGALVGAVCGLAGSVGIHAHCPVVTASHVLLAHGLPVAVLAALGALLGVRRGRV